MGKICISCKIENGTDDCGFGKDKSSKDGLENRCKLCNRKRAKKISSRKSSKSKGIKTKLV